MGRDVLLGRNGLNVTLWDALTTPPIPGDISLGTIGPPAFQTPRCIYACSCHLKLRVKSVPRISSQSAARTSPSVTPQLGLFEDGRILC